MSVSSLPLPFNERPRPDDPERPRARLLLMLSTFLAGLPSSSAFSAPAQSISFLSAASSLAPALLATDRILKVGNSQSVTETNLRTLMQSERALQSSEVRLLISTKSKCICQRIVCGSIILRRPCLLRGLQAIATVTSAICSRLFERLEITTSLRRDAAQQ